MLAAFYPDLTEINGTWINDEGLSELGNISGSALTSVDFGIIDTTNHGIDMLCKGNPNLKCLSLSIQYSDRCNVTDESVRSIVKYCPKLERISLVGWRDISNESLVLLRTLACLKEINLTRCSGFADDFESLKGLTSTGLMGFIRSNGANLEVIKLHEALSTLAGNIICDNALLQCIGECCPNLRVLNTKIASDITESTYEALFHGCPLLETLVSTNTTDTALALLAEYCPRLEKLVVSDAACGDTGIIALTSRENSALKSLRVQFADQLTNSSIVSLASLSGLQELTLVKLTRVTDEAMCMLFEWCTQLTDVCLTAAPLITDRSIATLVTRCRRLKNISLSDLAAVTQLSMTALAFLVPTLESLDIALSRCLTDDDVSLIAQHCKRLKHVEICFCPLITPQLITSLLTHGKQLTKIDVIHCGVDVNSRYVRSYHYRLPAARNVVVVSGGQSVKLG